MVLCSVVDVLALKERKDNKFNQRLLGPGNSTYTVPDFLRVEFPVLASHPPLTMSLPMLSTFLTPRQMSKDASSPGL